MIQAPPSASAGIRVTLHRSRRGVLLLLSRVVLLPLSVAALGHNLATFGHWTPQTWVLSIVFAGYVMAAFVELARSFGPTDVAVIDGDLVLFAPTLLRAPVRVARHQVVDARVTPRGWFGYRGHLPYTAGETAALTPERPDLGASVRVVVTLAAPVGLPWRRIRGPRGDLMRGRAMPGSARYLVLSAANRDLEPLRALLSAFLNAPLPVATVTAADRRRDLTVTCTRVTAAACAFAALLLIPHPIHDPLRALHTGVCLDAPQASTFADLDVVPCSSPHTAEVVGATQNAELASAGENDCATEYSIYAGSGSAHTAVHVQVLHRPGSNRGVCIAVLPSFVSYSLHAAAGATI